MTGISSEKIEPFDTGLEMIMSELANRRVILISHNSVLVQKKFYSLYCHFILNLYVVYESNTKAHNLNNNFALKNCLPGTIKLVRNSDKSKFSYNGRGIVFDRKCYWSFDNYFARNVVIFGGGISSSSHIDNSKNNFLALGKGPMKVLMEVLVQQKEISINFWKPNTKFCLSSHYNVDDL